MITIEINNLVVKGIHGVTAKEKKRAQPFHINIRMNTRAVPHHDNIEEALDYRLVKEITEHIVAHKQYNLLETLGDDIAQAILEKTSAENVSVTIQKPQIWKDGIPGVTITREKNPAHLDLIDFDMDEVVEALSRVHAISFPILGKERLQALLNEAQSYAFEEQPEILAGGKVHEQVSSVTALPRESLFFKLQSDFSELLTRKITKLGMQHIFAPVLRFTELSLQKYKAGSIGITPHRDGASRVNLICVFMLSGSAELGVCKDREGSNPHYLDTTPGNVMLLRAPGFFGSTFEPFHFVSNIPEERIVFGLRQKLVLCN